MEHLRHEVQSNTHAIRAAQKLLAMLCVTVICCTIVIFSVVWWYGSRVDLSIQLLRQTDEFKSSRTKTVTMAREGRVDASRIRAELAIDPIGNAESIERVNKLDAMLADVIESNGGVR